MCVRVFARTCVYYVTVFENYVFICSEVFSKNDFPEMYTDLFSFFYLS